ncbi:MAG: GAF domain-containing protein [Chloroflexi bacterium]|nr:MAG: GAF domain-containing protein [Chloroflexota bacterium]MCE7859279.1 GAF domain-containing protein [Chloroflexi bacterium CFX2]
MEFDRQPSQEISESRPIETSLGLKLTLVAVGLLLFGFIVYSVITIRISQGDLVANLESDLTKETADTVALIQTKLEQARFAALNLAIAVESGVSEEADLQQLLETSLAANSQIYGMSIGFEPNQLKPNLSSWAVRYRRTADGNIESIMLDDYFEREWYLHPKSVVDVSLSAPYQDDNTGDGNWIITTSLPFFDDSGGFRGVVSSDLEMTAIQDIFIDTKVESLGYVFLLDDRGTILGIGKQGQVYEPMVDSMFALAESEPTGTWTNLIENMTGEKSGFLLATDWEGNRMYVAFAPVGMNTGWSLAFVYPETDIIQKSRSLQTTLTAYSFLLAILFGIIILYFSRNITNPLKRLTEVAEEISKGNLQISADVASNDEVGLLSETINRMTVQLRDTLSNLENRINERTRDLEASRRQSEMRAAQYLAIGEISKLINSKQELNILLPLITRLVSERFDYYHVGIFLLDATRQYAVLQASNSLGGQEMLKRSHKLKVGESGIVGFAAKSGVPRIALDVGNDAVFFNNPDLPATRSEAAIPLKAYETIIGILDLQSDKPGAFTENDINMFSILADQIAIAIENTRLYEQTRQALVEARQAYQQTLQEGWKNLAQEEGTIGYYQSLTGNRRLTKPITTEEINQAMFRGETLIFHADGKIDDPVLVIPIKLREQIIGTLHIKSPSRDRQWTQSEIDLAEAVSERLSLSLENARLIHESQRQAIKEQTIGEITGKLGSSINLYNVLVTAVEELGRTIPGSEVTIKLKDDKNGNG